MHLFILRQGVFPQLVSSTFVKAKATNRRRCRFHPGHAQHTTTPGSHCVKSSTSSSGSSSDRRHVDVNWWIFGTLTCKHGKTSAHSSFLIGTTTFNHSTWVFETETLGMMMCQCTLIYIFSNLTNMDMLTSQSPHKFQDTTTSFQSLRRWHQKFQSHPTLLQSKERFGGVNGGNPLPFTLWVLFEGSCDE